MYVSLIWKRQPTLPRLNGLKLHLVQTWQGLASTGSLPTPFLKLKVDLKPMDGRNKAAAAPLPAKISIWKASLQLGPSPSPGVMLRKLGPVSDTSPCAVPSAKT